MSKVLSAATGNIVTFTAMPEPVACQTISHDSTGKRKQEALVFRNLNLSAPSVLAAKLVISITMSPDANLHYSLGKDKTNIHDMDTSFFEHLTLIYGQIKSSTIDGARDAAIDGPVEDPRSPIQENNEQVRDTSPIRSEAHVQADVTLVSKPESQKQEFSIVSFTQCVRSSMIDSSKTPEWVSLDEIYGGSSSIQSLDRIDETSEEQPQCVVCLSDAAQLFILPCRHLCLCMDCWVGGATTSGAAGTVDTASNGPVVEPIENDEGLVVRQEDGTESSPAMELQVMSEARVQTNWTACPVCRGPVKSWIEMAELSKKKASHAKPILLTNEIRSSAVVGDHDA